MDRELGALAVKARLDTGPTAPELAEDRVKRLGVKRLDQPAT